MIPKTDVVIPARNEARTIGPIVVSLKRHRRIGRVFVAVDAATEDNTAKIAKSAGAVIVDHFTFGKGQTVQAGLTYVSTPHVLFCDADYTGLAQWHITRMTQYPRNQIQRIGQPDIPDNYPDDKVWAWPWVSGIRRVPTDIARSLDLHGYLMEVQLNQACDDARVPTMITRLTGLQSAYNMTARRLAERDRDFRWGCDHGVIGYIQKKERT